MASKFVQNVICIDDILGSRRRYMHTYNIHIYKYMHMHTHPYIFFELCTFGMHTVHVVHRRTFYHSTLKKVIKTCVIKK